MQRLEIEGQWLGTIEGTNTGEIVLELEMREGFNMGWAYFHDRQEEFSVAVELSFDQQNTWEWHEFTPQPIDQQTGLFLETKETQELLDQHLFPKRVVLKLTPNGQAINFVWKTDIQTQGAGTLVKSDCSANSSVQVRRLNSWREFFDVTEEHFGRNIVYRGQPKPFPLQTSFHRTGRSDMEKYIRSDLQKVRRRTSHVFNGLFETETAERHAAFLSLAQHHGFPTPLLDWTHSPYVASYFAFSTKATDDRNFVRIFCLDLDNLSRAQRVEAKSYTLSPPVLHTMDAPTLANDRIGPQQGIFTFCNVRNIEFLVSKLEADSGSKILWSYEMPPELCKEVLQKLRLMNVTKATLFPGLESIFEDFRLKTFESR